MPHLGMHNMEKTIANELFSTSTSTHHWKRLLFNLQKIIANCTTREQKLYAVGCIFYSMREEWITGRKRYNRTLHIDPLVDMINKDCGLTLTDVENTLLQVEDDDQYYLAPKSYSFFTGMILQKILGIPERKRVEPYGNPKFMESPSPSTLPDPNMFFKNKRMEVGKI